MTKFIFALRESLKSLYKRAFVTWLSIATITGSIFVLGLFLLVSYNLQHQLKGIQSQVHAEIFLRSGATESETKALIADFEKLDWVKSTSYISSDEAMKIFVKEFDPILLQSLPENPLPASIVLHFEDDRNLGDIADRLESFVQNRRAVDGTFLPTETMKTLSNAREVFSWLTIAWAIIILFASIIVVTNTIRLAMLSRQETIEVMKLVGADSSFVRMPFLFEGIIQGILSSIFSMGLIYFIGRVVVFALPATVALPKPMVVLLGLFGIIFGILGSRIAISKYV